MAAAAAAAPPDTADAEQRAEEAESLQAIFGEDAVEVLEGSNAVRVYVPSRAEPLATLHVLLPDHYPSRDGPVLQLQADGLPQAEDVVRAMEGLFTPGQVCLFDCIDYLREQLQLWQEQQQADAAAACELAAGVARLNSQGRSGSGAADAASSSGGGSSSGWQDGELDDAELHHLPECSQQHRQRAQEQQQAQGADFEALMEQMRPRIISGEPLTERKSTFQAHVAPVTHVDEVKAVVAVLLENNKIQHATHNIMAYRIEAAPQRPGTFLQDCDDDGEAAAGGRLLHLLQVADVRGAVVVVSRWFGGVLLGPARFGLINNAARQLLEQTGFINRQPAGGGGGGAKKGKGGK